VAGADLQTRWRRIVASVVDGGTDLAVWFAAGLAAVEFDFAGGVGSEFSDVAASDAGDVRGAGNVAHGSNRNSGCSIVRVVVR